MRIHRFLFAVLALWMGAATARAQDLTIHCGRLIDGTGKPPQQQVTLVVEKGKVARIVAGYQSAGPGSTLLDWSKRTVLPGLIDCHVHLDHEHSEADLENEVRQNPEDQAFQAAAYAKATLKAGFTTVRDLGGSGVNLSLRNAIRKGLTPGPRIICAGVPIGSTGGHMDPRNGLNATLRSAVDQQTDNIADGPDECRRAVRRQYQNGADVIKIAATGGVLSYAKDGTRPQFTQEEMNAVVQTASDYGLRVAAHAHGAEGMKRALRAGVASIEHGTLMDDEAIVLFKQKGAYYVPTLTAGRATTDSAKKPGHYPEIIAAKARAISPQMMGTFAKAYKAGVKIAYGTDAGVFRHGLNALEAQYMVEGGMPPAEVIVAATKSASELLGISADVGTLEPGKLADLIATEGNPLEDIKQLSHVAAVVQGGKLVE